MQTHEATMHRVEAELADVLREFQAVLDDGIQ